MYADYGKRLMDITLALVLALPALVLCLVCIVLIRREDAAPAVFRQVRVGYHRRPFTLYKLRTMSTGTGDRASHEISTAQITRVGRLLRRTKLDELPQLVNVLRGDMSFVGPRPCLPSQDVLVSERDKRGVYEVRPGITGPAQLSGIDMSTPVELAEADARYAAQIRFMDDLRYIVRTATGGGSGDAVRSA